MKKDARKKIILTPRETEVAISILKHFNAKKVAKELKISVAGVNYFSSFLREKMDVSNTVQAALMAKELGLLDDY
jgi:DNA-binding NarL/FixJ family response regulator